MWVGRLPQVGNTLEAAIFVTGHKNLRNMQSAPGRELSSRRLLQPFDEAGDRPHDFVASRGYADGPMLNRLRAASFRDRRAAPRAVPSAKS